MRNVGSATKIRVLLADDDENQRASQAKMIQSWGIAVADRLQRRLFYQGVLGDLVGLAQRCSSSFH